MSSLRSSILASNTLTIFPIVPATNRPCSTTILKRMGRRCSTARRQKLPDVGGGHGCRSLPDCYLQKDRCNRRLVHYNHTRAAVHKQVLAVRVSSIITLNRFRYLSLRGSMTRSKGFCGLISSLAELRCGIVCLYQVLHCATGSLEIPKVLTEFARKDIPVFTTAALTHMAATTPVSATPIVRAR